MSRIGKEPVKLEKGVEINVAGGGLGSLVSVKGPLGELTERIPAGIAVEKSGDEVIVKPEAEEGLTPKIMGYHGLSRSLINNMVIGVTKGFDKRLEIVGVGYRAEKKGKKLALSLGFSHPVEMEDPEGITTDAPSQNEIIVKGISKEKVGNYAAKIRAKRPPEPYKGKGVRYVGEYVRKKEGKAGVKAEA
jgi:large subunit ribosomal protein L6